MEPILKKQENNENELKIESNEKNDLKSPSETND